MPCGCGGSRTTVSAFGTHQSQPTITDQGMIVLASAPECEQPYSGVFRSASVYVVGLGTDAETVYLRADRERAVRDAKQRRATFDHLPAKQLCDDKMRELLGA
jgi:hypothetical protein